MMEISPIWLALCTVLGLSACANDSPSTKASPSNSNTPAVTTPAPTTGFRFTQEEMQDIANPKKLSWRIFYDKPSQGEHAQWFDAVKRGDLATVQKMVEQGQNLEAKDEASLGQTALGWAAFIGYEDMVDYLISKGASLQATDRGDVYNVLKSAVLGKNVNIVKKIHKLLPNTDFNDQSLEDDGETLIMVAASNNRIEIVKYLLTQGANPNLVAKKDASALSYACERGHTEMQQLLISHGVINHKTGKSSCQ